MYLIVFRLHVLFKTKNVIAEDGYSAKRSSLEITTRRIFSTFDLYQNTTTKINTNLLLYAHYVYM